MAAKIEPNWTHGVPFCDHGCGSYDGKRCMQLGMRPGRICEPAVSEMRNSALEEAELVTLAERASELEAYDGVDVHGVNSRIERVLASIRALKSRR